MIFEPTAIAGALLVKPEKRYDERGFFTRVWCREEFVAQGLANVLDQCNLSRNTLRGTLRGLHVQQPPHAEAKLVRCSSGSVYDVIVDLRPLSPSYMQWIGVVLDAREDHALYVPAGCAHGFQTLVDDAVVFYQNSGPYHPESADGFRWDDPAFGITWPVERVIVSDQDRTHELFAARTTIRRAGSAARAPMGGA